MPPDSLNIPCTLTPSISKIIDPLADKYRSIRVNNKVNVNL